MNQEDIGEIYNSNQSSEVYPANADPNRNHHGMCLD